MAIPNSNLYNVTKYYIVNTLSLTHEDTDFECQQSSEAEGPVYSSWNEAKLGAQPKIATVMASEAAWQAAADAVAYQKERRKAYKENFTVEEELEALREKLRGDTTNFDAQNTVIDQIKTQYPKP